MNRWLACQFIGRFRRGVVLAYLTTESLRSRIMLIFVRKDGGRGFYYFYRCCWRRVTIVRFVFICQQGNTPTERGCSAAANGQRSILSLPLPRAVCLQKTSRSQSIATIIEEKKGAIKFIFAQTYITYIANLLLIEFTA